MRKQTGHAWVDIMLADSALADHCARLQIIFTYLLTYNVSDANSSGGSLFYIFY